MDEKVICQNLKNG